MRSLFAKAWREVSNNLPQTARATGWPVALNVSAIAFATAAFRILRLSWRPVVSVLPRSLGRRVYLRIGSSDVCVFRQVFVSCQLSCDNVQDAAAIVDCGANVGYTTLYMLRKFPNARVLAVEPDPANVRMWLLNLADNPRATLLRAAVWSHATSLCLSRGTFGDGREWATAVREPLRGEAGDTTAIDMERLIALSGGRIDLLKVDIEGSERTLFRGDCGWLRNVSHLAIELHDPGCRRAFYAAMRDYDCNMFDSGELTFCINIRPVALYQ